MKKLTVNGFCCERMNPDQTTFLDLTTLALARVVSQERVELAEKIMTPEWLAKHLPIRIREVKIETTDLKDEG